MLDRVRQTYLPVSDQALQRISVIIPTYRDDPALICLLEQLRRHDVFEIIIVDGEDRWEKPASFSGFDNIRWTAAVRGRGPQIAHGLSRAKGDYLWVLHADSEIHENSVPEIANILKNRAVSLGMFQLNFNRPRWDYRLFEFFASFDMPLSSFGDQGFFFRKDDMDKIWTQLYPALQKAPILEDVILRHRLKRLGRIQKSRLKIGTSPHRFERYGLWRTQICNAIILARSRLGTPAELLYQSYYARPARPVLKEKMPCEPNSVTLTSSVETL